MIDWIIMDMQPYDTVRSQYFMDIYKAAVMSKTAQPISVPTLKDRIAARCTDVRAKLITEIKTAGHVNITTDGWTSRSLLDYAGVSAHFLDDTFTMQTRCLGIVRLQADHTAQSISARIRSLLHSFDVIPFTVTCDRGANFVAAIRQMGYHQIKCICHVLDTAVKDSIEKSPLQDVCERFRKLYNVFKNSVQRVDYLLAAQHGAEKRKLIIDVRTRWNSTLFMLKRGVLLRDAIAAAMAAIRDDDIQAIPNAVWREVEDAIKVLAPIEAFSRRSEGEKYVTASSVILYFHELQRQIARVDISEANIVRFREQILQKLRDLGTQHVTTDHKLIKAAFFDARFKTLYWMDDEKFGGDEKSRERRTTVINELRAEFKDFAAGVRAAAAAAAPPVAAAAAAAAVAVPLPMLGPDDPMEPPILPPLPAPEADEFEHWLNVEQRIPIKGGPAPLEWWRAKEKDPKNEYPILSRFVRRYLSIQASAAPIERIWSHAGRLVDRRRTALKSDSIEQHIFLYENAALMQFEGGR